MPSDPSADATAALRAATLPQLRERVRTGLALSVVAIGLFAVVDLVFRPHLLAPLFAIAGGQLALVAAAWAGLRRCTGWTATVGLVLGLMALLFVTGVVSDAVSGTYEATALISLVACLVTAALLPWGVGPQIVMTGLAAVTNAASLLLVRGGFGDLGHLVATAAVLLIGAIFAAAASERARRARFRTDAALDAARQRAEEEAAVSAALLEVSQTLAAHLGQPDMLDRAHAVALKVLGCDWSTTFTLDERREVVRMLASAGSRPETHAAVAGMEFPAAGLEAIARTCADDVMEIASPETQPFLDPALLRSIDVASAMCVAITVRGRIAGVQAHGYRNRTGAFTPLERRLAVGMAQATALALENARLISDLQAASHLKTEFVATMSHELRTPLNVIMGYTDMLLEEAFGTLAPPQHETLARVARSAEELLELVNATLDVGRLESGREPVERAPVDVAGLCGELDRELRPLAAEETALVWRHGGLPAVLADRTKVKTILRNLAGNALKFTRTGRVEVDVTWDDGVLELRVADTGIGIAADQLPFVFDMFRQVDGSSTRRFGGVGLGLHIVRRLAELLGGSVTVTSTLGVGSTFVVRLPAPPAALRATGS